MSSGIIKGEIMAQDFERTYASSISNSSGSPTTLVTSNSDDAIVSIMLMMVQINIQLVKLFQLY